MDQAEILRRWVKRKEQGFDVDVATVVQEQLLGKTTTVGVIGADNESLENSNLLANIAVSMAKNNQSVLLVDAYKGKIDSSIPLGIYPKHTLEDLLHKRTASQEAIYVGACGVKFIKAHDILSHLDRLDVNARNNFFREWAQLEESSDVVFINDSTLSPILNFNHLLVIASTNSESITAVYEKLRKFIRNSDDKVTVSLIVNMCTTEAKGKLVAKKFIATAKKFLSMDVTELGVIVLEPEIIKALKARVCFVAKYPYLRATHNLSALAKNFARLLENDTQKEMEFQ